MMFICASETVKMWQFVCFSIDLELHPVLCIDQPLTVAVHGGVGHRAQVDPEAELVVGEILGQRHVGPTTLW